MASLTLSGFSMTVRTRPITRTNHKPCRISCVKWVSQLLISFFNSMPQSHLQFVYKPFRFQYSLYIFCFCLILCEGRTQRGYMGHHKQAIWLDGRSIEGSRKTQSFARHLRCKPVKKNSVATLFVK